MKDLNNKILLSTKDRKQLFSFEGKEVYCIKDVYKAILFTSKRFIASTGDFYTIQFILDSTGIKRLNTNICLTVIGNDEVNAEFYYEDFIQHFELITKAEIRQRKIKSVLE